MSEFPSMKAAKLYAILTRQPLGYRVVRQSGSHRRLAAAGRPSFTWAYHDRRTLKPREVRRVLVAQVGLAESDALDLL